MFRTKICGVTRPADAEMIAEVGADAIGLNFYARSKRYVEPAAAEKIAKRVVGRLQLVGVFVNASPEEIAAIADQVGLTAMQIHGDEPPSAVAAVAVATQLPVVRAQRFGQQGVDALTEDLAACQSAGRAPETLLVDAAAPSGEYGGAGVQLPWERLELDRGNLADTPVVLAGGLEPDNVAEAIRTVGPFGVDVASGVESAPGVKDPELCQRFVSAALAALRQLGR